MPDPFDPFTLLDPQVVTPSFLLIFALMCFVLGWIVRHYVWGGLMYRRGYHRCLHDRHTRRGQFL